jgi:lactate 2-monooxygenase
LCGGRCSARQSLALIAIGGDIDHLTGWLDGVGGRLAAIASYQKDRITMANFGDFQNGVYADAVRGVNTRYPFDFASIERKASEALPDWVYRYVSAAAGDGRTQRANIAAYSCYGIVPRMMVSPPERDLSIELFGKHLVSPMFLCPIGLVGLCAPDFHGDVAAAQASAATGVPFTLSTFTQTPMEDVIPHAGATPSFFQLYLPVIGSWRRA